MTLLIVKDLSTSFKRPDQTSFEAVKKISFSVEAGNTLALVGESGSGKSVSALSILGLLPYPQAYHPSGSILFQNQELLNQSEKTLRRYRGKDIGMIFQEPMTALNPLHTIEQQISETLFLHLNLTKSQAKNRVKDLLKLVGFPEGLDRLSAYPHQLSGGQRQRVMIAIALACEPKLLIADEPTTALDVTVQAGILELLKSLQKRMNMGILMITHDLGVVRATADTVAVMKNGEIVEQGETSSLFTSPTHPYTHHLIASEPSGTPPALQPHATEVLKAHHIYVTFKQKKKLFSTPSPELKAVQDVSLSLKTGETLGIVGESGSGKSTLAYALLRLQESEGQIILEGTAIEKLTKKEIRPLRQKMQIVFQDPFSSLNPRFSIFDIVSEGLKVHHPHLKPSEIQEAVRKIITEVGLPVDILHRYPHEFSGGQRQRIAIARALILKPKVLVLDEPTSALDRSVQSEIITLLRSLQKHHQLAYLFISHDLKVVKAMSHKILVMKNGKVVEMGDAETLFNHPKSVYTQNLLKASQLLI